MGLARTLFSSRCDERQIALAKSVSRGRIGSVHRGMRYKHVSILVLRRKAIQGDIKLPTENGDSRPIRATPDWGVSSMPLDLFHFGCRLFVAGGRARRVRQNIFLLSMTG